MEQLRTTTDQERGDARHRNRASRACATLALATALSLAGCGREPMRPDRARASLADGVSRAESLAILSQLGATRTTAALLGDQACTLTWSDADTVTGCNAPVPDVVPLVPWLQHSGQAVDSGEVEYRDPISISFADSVSAVHLSSTGALKCTGTHGRMTGFRNGIQVVQADNQLIDPSDCGVDDLTYGVQGQLPDSVQIDSLVIEGVDPWTFEVLGNCCGRALLKYTIQFAAPCPDTVQTIIGEYVTYQVNLSPICAAFSTDGGSAHFSWSELNDAWTGGGNPHRPWGMIGQGLLDGLEQARTNYDHGGVRLSSGYRCPHGNSAVGGVANSYHMHGRAADMYSADYTWTKQEFGRLFRAARSTNPAPIEIFDWDYYPTNHHLHSAW